MLRKGWEQDVEYIIEALPEPDNPEGHFASGDDDADEEMVAQIMEDHANGNDWAWCIVKVTATLKGTTLYGHDYLGGCSYKSEKDFIENSGYYEDMKQEALKELRSQLETIVEKVTQ